MCLQDFVESLFFFFFFLLKLFTALFDGLFYNKNRSSLKTHSESQGANENSYAKQGNCLKRGKTRVTKSHLIGRDGHGFS